MASETIVAVFSNLSQAEAAISDLVASGVPSTSIKHYARDDNAFQGTQTDTTSHHRHGFWAWLTGQENTTDEHSDVYDRSIQSGRTVVTVVSDGSNVDQIYSILDRHEPLDVDDHDQAGTTTAGYGAGHPVGNAQPYADTAPTGSPVVAPMAASGAGTAGLGTTATGTQATAGTAGYGTATTGRVGMEAGTSEQVIPLSEETLQVGKREIDRGTTRIRRYTVERPVEEHVRLRDETVSVFRRPVTGASTIGADAFSDREIVVTETDEEAVVAKTARVVEEVVVQKGVNERVETVRDTVRRDEVEIDGPAGQGTGTTTQTGRTPGSTI